MATPDVGHLRLPRGGHYIFFAHHLGLAFLVVLFVVLLVVALRNSRS